MDIVVPLIGGLELLHVYCPTQIYCMIHQLLMTSLLIEYNLDKLGCVLPYAAKLLPRVVHPEMIPKASQS